MTLKQRLTSEKAMSTWLSIFVVITAVALGVSIYAAVSGFQTSKDTERIDRLQTELAEAQNDLEALFGLERQDGVLRVTGKKGATGLRGPTGPRGPQGPAGKRGATGARGPQGARGPAGSRGARGLRGLRGEQGPRGPSGPQGIPGVSPAIEQVIAAICAQLPKGICNGGSQ